jgi:predicted DNA-binding transcriptional regulator AlpA
MPKTSLSAFHNIPKEGYVRLPTILFHIPVGRSTFLKKVSDGIYPSPVKLSERVSAWRVEDIRNLIEGFDNE